MRATELAVRPAVIPITPSMSSQTRRVCGQVASSGHEHGMFGRSMADTWAPVLHALARPELQARSQPLGTLKAPASSGR